ncbi:hypothetical protein [Streptomyces milbemycinicus]|uniref:Transposase n=1 Tax=Streptomyces milbemycinicus TaxID=476552 RepID=A0ABW8LCH2_9ACTN
MPGWRCAQALVDGTEWWLYVCNRIAEEPQRFFRAITDAADW